MKERAFVIQEMINESATTTVCKAHQSVLDRTVLLKILHKHLIGDRELIERFTREARACALIRSDYIVQVYDLTEIDGAPAIVMEYVHGTSLKDVLASGGPMPVDVARRIVVETLNGLRSAHSRGVIHRDIKPGNLLVTDTGHIKVTDFGLAAIAASQTVTMEGTVLGTPAYLPPEHIRGEAADERSDLFSLGATFIEILTGRRIFEGASYSACINNILQFDTALVDTLVADRLCADVIKKMMHPDREQRFVSADAALRALDGESEMISQQRGTTSNVSLPQSGLLHLRSLQQTEPSSSVFSHQSEPVPSRSLDSSELPSVVLSPQSELLLSGSLLQPEPQPPVFSPHSDPKRRFVRTGRAVVLSGAIVLAIAFVLTILREANGISGKPPIVPLIRDSGQKTMQNSEQNFTQNYGQISEQNFIRDSMQKSVDRRTVDIPASVSNFRTGEKVDNAVNASGVMTGISKSNVNAAAKDSSTLVVTCMPWAKVFLDNQYLGETPLGGTVTVRAGTHTLNFTNPQFLPIVKTITAEPGIQQTVSVNFFETVGFLLITVIPWAEIYIDDQYRDTTPMEKPIAVTVGKRTLRLHNPGFTDMVADVSVSRNDTLRFSYSLTKVR